MQNEVSKWLGKILFLVLFSYALLMPAISHALPFNIVPKAGTILPTFVNFENGPAEAYYTVTNNTISQRNNNYVKYLPPNVRQIATGGTFTDTCGTTFNLAPRGFPGDSCTLQLEVFGPVNVNDPDPHHHLFVCFPAGLTCAGTNSGLNVNAVILSSIVVLPALANIFLNDTLQYTAIGSYSDGTSQVLTPQVLWQSSDPSVATISASGLATGVSEGTTIITASLQSMASNPATLNVGVIRLTSIAITPVLADTLVNQSVQYHATGTFSNNTTADLTNSVNWRTSSANVATISATGSATTQDTGSTAISAEMQGVVSNTATLNVSEVVLTSIDIIPQSADATSGQTIQYSATGNYSDGTSADLTNLVNWRSSNVSIATIAPGGLATADQSGSTTISAEYQGVTSNAALLNVDNPLQSIVVTPDPATVTSLQTLQFMATGHYADQSTQNITPFVTWISTDPNVATISNTGLATGMAPGTTTIFASQNDISSQGASLTVTNP